MTFDPKWQSAITLGSECVKLERVNILLKSFHQRVIFGKAGSFTASSNRELGLRITSCFLNM